MKIRPMGAELLRTDRRTDMTKLIVALNNSVKASKKGTWGWGLDWSGSAWGPIANSCHGKWITELHKRLGDLLTRSAAVRFSWWTPFNVHKCNSAVLRESFSLATTSVYKPFSFEDRQTKDTKLPKVKIMAGYYRLNTTILSDAYKYLNYMFRPLLPSSGWIEYKTEKLHNIIWYSTNISVV